MKKVFSILALFVFSLNANSQEGKMNAFKVNLFSPIVKTGSFFYERAVSEKSSAQLGVGFTAYNREGIKITGFFLTPEYRFYLSEEVLNGFYVGPFVRYQNLKIKDNFDGSSTDEATLSTFGGGVVVGRQWLFKDIITLDLFAGPSYNSGKVKVTSGSDPDVPSSFEGFGVRAGVTLGVAF